MTWYSLRDSGRSIQWSLVLGEAMPVTDPTVSIYQMLASLGERPLVVLRLIHLTSSGVARLNQLDKVLG